MMPDFLDRILGRTPTKKSGSMAKERLQFVLVHDRINLPPERLEAMKLEILAVISKYVSIDSENVDINLQNRERSSLLVAEIPFLKTLEGIEKDDDEDEETTPTDSKTETPKPGTPKRTRADNKKKAAD